MNHGGHGGHRGLPRPSSVSAVSSVVPLLCLSLGAPLAAQPADTLRLPVVMRAALAADPRRRQIDLAAEQSALRLRNLDAERLPQLAAAGQAQYQSDVPRVPLALPNVRVPSPPHDTYDAHAEAQLSLLDPTRAARRGAERAQLVETQAGVRTSLFALRQEVVESFFAAAALDARHATLAATLVELEARLREAAVRVRGGAALPSDTASIAATLLQRRQDLLQADADRRAALARLAELTDAAPDTNAPLALPDLAAAAARARASLDSVRARPEYAQLEATRQRLARQAELQTARERPQISAFARAGYGRPGLNPLATAFDTYWLGGVQLRWTPWTWGTAAREREAITLQREVVDANEAALTRQLRRAVEGDLATIDRLAATMALDDGIVALRERVERETRARLGEGVVTAAEYASREAELLAARLARDEHRVALAAARARFLTTLGLEIP